MQAVASPVSPADTTRRCYARIGLLGNPSDGYGGATLACSLANFWAEVTCTRAPQITFQFHPVHDCGAYASLEALSAHVSSCGVGTGVDLLKSMASVFYKHCQEHGVQLDESRGAFSVSWDTNIPRQSGLAGSSAIATAGLRCLMDWYNLTPSHIPLHTQPNLVLAAETALGITAGLQDRVAQAYGGLVYMDFASVATQGHGDYEPLDPGILPPMWLIWGDFGSASGKVHSSVRQRWQDGDREVHDAMRELAEIARQGRAALQQGDIAAFAQLMDQNFSVRRRVFGDAAVGQANIRMVEVAKSVGASAKLPGSGGAVIALCPQGAEQEAALQAACAQEGLHIARVMVGPSHIQG